MVERFVGIDNRRRFGLRIIRLVGFCVCGRGYLLEYCFCRLDVGFVDGFGDGNIIVEFVK